MKSHWGLWFHMHEHVPMSMRDKFLVHWRANVGMLREKKILALSSFIAILPSLVFGLALWYFDPLSQRRSPATSISLTALLALIGGGMAFWLAVQHLFFVYTMNRYYAPFVRREIALLGMPMCPACGHLLANMQVRRCPECATHMQSNNS